MLLIKYKKWDVASAESDVHVLMLPVISTRFSVDL